MPTILFSLLINEATGKMLGPDHRALDTQVYAYIHAEMLKYIC